MSKKIDHINLTVPSIQDTIDYYVNVLGYQVEKQFEGNGKLFAFLSDGITTYEVVENKTISETIIAHIAYVSDDIEADYQKYKELGLTTTELMYADFLFENGIHYFFIKGPGSEKIEFVSKK